MVGNLPLLHAASEQLIGRLGPDDAARVGTFGHQVEISPTFTKNSRQLLNALPPMISPDAPTPLWRGIDEALSAFKGGDRRTDGGGSGAGGAAGDREEFERRANERRAGSAGSTGSAGSAGSAGSNAPADDDVRNVILVLSDGKDSGPIGFRERFVSQAEIIDRARAEGVMIYAVGMRSRGNRPMQQPGIGPGALGAMLVADLPDPGLARVAEETGGGYTEIRFGEDLAAAFRRVADELHSQYLLGYAPPKRDGKVHDIDVRLVNQRGLKPRARKDYVAPKG
jgi:VWFA-related protein